MAATSRLRPRTRTTIQDTKLHVNLPGFARIFHSATRYFFQSEEFSTRHAPRQTQTPIESIAPSITIATLADPLRMPDMKQPQAQSQAQSQPSPTISIASKYLYMICKSSADHRCAVPNQIRRSCVKFTFLI